jgi:preprotein translocase subunit YajC
MAIKQFGMLAIIIIVMWVLIFLPQRKRQKELDTLVKSMKAGDKVVTSSGIVGVVLSVKDRSVAIRSAESKLEILKSAVAEITDRGGEVTETKS